MQIQLNQVGYFYPGIKTKYIALEDINLKIEGQDEFIAIIGHTGSGKSTLVQIMNALLIPTSGNANIFGQQLPPKKRDKINRLRQEVGLVFQFPEYQLFEETVLKDIMFGPKNFKNTAKDAEARAKIAAEMVGLEKNILSESPFRISGGQMRRVAIAGILAMDPKVLILDEPTRGLDPRGRDEIMNIFKNIHDDTHKSIILITHDMDLVSQYAKRVIVLENGKMKFDGTKEDFFHHPNFEDFNLDLPTPLKILRYLEKDINLPYEPKYDYESLVAYLKDLK